MYTGDLKVIDDDGTILYEGPAFLRCETFGCRKLATSGYLREHGKCVCGGNTFKQALVVLPEEQEGLKRGDYILTDWEKEFVLAELSD